MKERPLSDTAPESPNSPEVFLHLAERRRHFRHPVSNRFVHLATRWNGPHTRAVLKDISRSGIGLLFSSKLNAGSVVFVQLGEWTQSMTGQLTARVTHTTCRDDGLWALGCEFTCPLSDEEFQRLLGEEGPSYSTDGPEGGPEQRKE
jgi:hypothetical protein